MIRKLLPADADAVLRLRREALAREPLAFSSSPTEDRVQAGGVLEEYLAHRTKAIFGAFEPDLIGMAGIAQEEGAKSRHKARLWGVYVTPSHRGAGVGRALVQAAIEFARSLDGLTHVHLAVQARTACTLLLDRGFQRDGGINYGIWAKWTRRSETCVTGMVLSILSYFECDDTRLDTVARHLLEQQLPDGGWNCRRPDGATHASVHRTISVLEGLRLYELHRGRRFSFPPRWHYDILRALDHFQAVNAPCDPRLAEGIGIVQSSRGKDGRWSLQHSYKGKTYFELERHGAPSRWNTLRALRVLNWWDRGWGRHLPRMG
jgi:GNAT superfamily N-acetyltransferase